ncbi:MAG: M23 family metallopeptidase [Fidelibacterota bacterium]
MKLPFRKKKQSRAVRFVVMSDDDGDVKQWSLSHNSLATISILVIVLCSALLFFTADFLTDVLYQSRLIEYRQKHQILTTSVTKLEDKLDKMVNEIMEIEEKDKALRTYANLPQVDLDVRKLGVGGRNVGGTGSINELLPNLESKLAALEVDLEDLARKIRFERESFSTIYDAIRENSEKISSIPSIRPVEGGYLNTGYGYRPDPFTKERGFHYGLDISANRGTPIYASADGKIVLASYHGSYGKTVKINHGHGYQSLYAHLNKVYVRPGQKIKRGDVIGEVGATGRTTGPHLHYEVHYYGTPQDPQNYFFSGPIK